mgnify:FL=1
MLKHFKAGPLVVQCCISLLCIPDQLHFMHACMWLAACSCGFLWLPLPTCQQTAAERRATN